MLINKKKLRIAAEPIVLFFSVLSIIAVAYYILFPAKGEFSSDSTDTLMWAVASYKSGALFSKTFNYAGLIPFGGQLIMLPLVAIFGESYTANAIGMLIFFLLFVISAYFMLKQLRLSQNWSLFTVAILILFLSTSGKLREIFWQHIIYYSLGVFFTFVGMNLVYRLIGALHTSKKLPFDKKSLVYLILTALWYMLCATDRLESLTIFIIPSMGGLFGILAFDFRHRKDKRLTQSYAITLIDVIISTGIGYIIGGILEKGFYAGYEKGYSAMCSPDKWNENLMSFFKQWCYLLDVNKNVENIYILSKDGIIAVIRIFTGLFILAAPIVATCLWKKINDVRFRIFIILHWTLTILIMSGYVFTYISSASWRISPIMCTCIIITMLLIHWFYKNDEYRVMAYLAIIPMIITSVISLAGIYEMPVNYNQKGNILFSAMDFLEDNNLTYGYATFWNANSITVLSGDKIKIRSITLEDDGTYSEYSYQQDKEWYNGDDSVSQYFVLMTVSEYDLASANDNILIQTCSKKYMQSDFYVLVYDKNIFDNKGQTTQETSVLSKSWRGNW